MLLTIDIGNTLTKFGFFDAANLIERLTIPTERNARASELTEIFKSHSKVWRVIISSVVPELTSTYHELSNKISGSEPIFVDNSFNLGLEIKYYPPENLGVDRIVDAFAAVEKYGQPCIVCDFGTATTIDAINSKKEYQGGIIAPGIKTLADSLHQKTSKLPPVEIAKPEKIIGDSTVAAIQSGVYFGYIGLVENILRKMIIELGEVPLIVATGGFADLIAPEVALIEVVDENLTLDGLRLIYEKLF